MNKTFIVSILVSILAITSSSVTALAADSVQFTSQELNAIYVLARPDLCSIELDGSSGTFAPSPPLKYFGVDAQTFAINLGFIGDISGLRFSQLKTNTPTIQFMNSMARLELPFGDNASAIRSDFGSIGFKGVSVVAYIDWTKPTNGEQDLAIQSMEFDGNLSGTGVLSSSFILGQVKKLAIQLVQQQIQKILSGSQIQQSIQTGLVQWGKISVGSAGTSVVPGSIQIFSDSGQSGISYQVE